MTETAEPPVVQGRSTVLVLAACIAFLLGIFALFFFNPAEHAFYPRCMLKLTTGLDCPGCGGLRATHQLLHGNVREAFALNPLFVVALPLTALALAFALAAKVGKRPLPRWVKTRLLVWTGAVVVIAFGVLRNVPWPR